MIVRTPGVLARQHRPCHLRRLGVDGAADEGHIHPLAFTRALAVHQRRQDTGDHVLGAQVIADDRPDDRWVSVIVAGHRHDSPLRLADHVSALAEGVGAFGTEGGATGVDDRWVDRLHVLVPDAPLLDGAGNEVVDDHVDRLGELHEGPPTARRSQVERGRPLPPVVPFEIRRPGVRLADREPPPEITDLGQFDLDHVGAEIPQHRRSLRTLDEDRQIQNLVTRECPHGHASYLVA